jgi:predicted nucleic acid-binding protein
VKWLLDTNTLSELTKPQPYPGLLEWLEQGQGRNSSVLDSQIEAIAVHFGLTVVTRNRVDFSHPVVNPWEPDALTPPHAPRNRGGCCIADRQ